MRKLLLGAWFLMTAVGCGGGDKDATGEGAFTLREACAAIASAMCDKMAECSPPSTPQCVQTFTSACCPSSVDCDAQIQGSGGKDAFDDCLDDFRDLSCAQISSGATPLDCR